MAAKPLTIEDLCRMNKPQLLEAADELEITLVSSKKEDILAEILSKFKSLQSDDIADAPVTVQPGAQPYADVSPSRTVPADDLKRRAQTDINLEFERIQREREREQFERERMQFQLEMKRLELQMQQRVSVPVRDNFRVVDAARLIPRFDASDLENYLHSFERICTINAWPKEHWSAILQTQLSGKALKVFSELSERECASYDVLKKALLVAYELCPEVYRKRFRSFVKVNTDTYADFAFKLNNVFKRWLEGTKAYNDIEKLRQTLLLEQFFQALPDDLKLWIVDQKTTTLPQAAQLCDQYVALHKSVSVKHETAGVDNNLQPKVLTVFNSSNNKNVADQKTGKFSPRSKRKFPNVICFRCRKRGHIMSQCRVKLKHNNDVAVTENVTNAETNDVNTVTVQSSVCNVDVHPLFQPYCKEGSLVHQNGAQTSINILRDTAALQSLLRSSDVPEDAVIHTGDFAGLEVYLVRLLMYH